MPFQIQKISTSCTTVLSALCTVSKKKWDAQWLKYDVRFVCITVIQYIPLMCNFALAYTHKLACDKLSTN